MGDTFVLSGLIKRRATLTGEIAHHQRIVKQKLIDLENLDNTILQFAPDYQLESIRSRSARAPSDWAMRGEMTRIIFSALRRATEPLTTAEVTEDVMRHKQLDLSDIKAVRVMRKRVCAALRAKTSDGAVRRLPGHGQAKLWELVR